MNNNSSLPTPTPTFEPISNIRLTRMPSRPQPKDKLCESAGVRFRISERFVYKPRLNAGSGWQLYDGLTIPRKENLILIGNPNRRTSKLVYTLADQAEYRILDISEIPFVTLATTRNIISGPAHMRFGQQNNDFQFTFGTPRGAVMASPQSQTHAQTSLTPSLALASPQPQPQPESAFSVSACIAAITSYFDFTSQKGTAQKRSRDTAFGGEEDMEANHRQRNRRGIGYSPYRRLWLRVLAT